MYKLIMWSMFQKKTTKEYIGYTLWVQPAIWRIPLQTLHTCQLVGDCQFQRFLDRGCQGPWYSFFSSWFWWCYPHMYAFSSSFLIFPILYVMLLVIVFVYWFLFIFLVYVYIVFFFIIVILIIFIYRRHFFWENKENVVGHYFLHPTVLGVMFNVFLWGHINIIVFCLVIISDPFYFSFLHTFTPFSLSSFLFIKKFYAKNHANCGNAVITGLIGQTYQRISVGQLQEALSLTGSELASVISSKAWREEQDAVVIPPSEEDLSSKAKKQGEPFSLDRIPSPLFLYVSWSLFYLFVSFCVAVCFVFLFFDLVPRNFKVIGKCKSLKVKKNVYLVDVGWVGLQASLMFSFYVYNITTIALPMATYLA